MGSKYVFPEIGDHTIAYLGRRYMLINTDGKYPIEHYQGSDEYVDLNLADYILLDGYDCVPFTTLVSKEGGEIEGELIGYENKQVYSSIKVAIKRLIKDRARIQKELFD